MKVEDACIIIILNIHFILGMAKFMYLTMTLGMFI